MCIIHQIVHVNHPSNTDGCSVSPSKVKILELSCESWGPCTQCVQTLKFDVLILEENEKLGRLKNMIVIHDKIHWKIKLRKDIIPHKLNYHCIS